MPKFAYARWETYGKKADGTEMRVRLGLVETGADQQGKKIYDLVVFGPTLEADTRPQDFIVNDENFIFPIHKAPGIKVNGENITTEGASKSAFTIICGKAALQREESHRQFKHTVFEPVRDALLKTVNDLDVNIDKVAITVDSSVQYLSAMKKLLEKMIDTFQGTNNPLSLDNTQIYGDIIEEISALTDKVRKLFLKVEEKLKTAVKNAGKFNKERKAGLDKSFEQLKTMFTAFNNLYALVAKNKDLRGTARSNVIMNFFKKTIDDFINPKPVVTNPNNKDNDIFEKMKKYRMEDEPEKPEDPEWLP